jgi:hypothetical protein
VLHLSVEHSLLLAKFASAQEVIWFFIYVPNDITPSKKLNVEISPNSFTTNLQLYNTQVGDLIKIYNIHGKLCFATKSISTNTIITTHHLSSGFHILEIKRVAQSIKHKIIKQ